MSSDYKYDMQMRAEELAEEQFDVQFSELTPEDQDKLFAQAQEWWIDAQFSKSGF